MDATVAAIVGAVLGAACGLGLAFVALVLVDNALDAWGR